VLEQRRAHSTRARRGGWRRTRGWKPQPSSAGSRDVPLASHRNLQPATRHTTLPASQEAASSASHRGPAVSVDSRESGVLGQRTADSGQRTADRRGGGGGGGTARRGPWHKTASRDTLPAHFFHHPSRLLMVRPSYLPRIPRYGAQKRVSSRVRNRAMFFCTV